MCLCFKLNCLPSLDCCLARIDFIFLLTSLSRFSASNPSSRTYIYYYLLTILSKRIHISFFLSLSSFFVNFLSVVLSSCCFDLNGLSGSSLSVGFLPSYYSVYVYSAPLSHIIIVVYDATHIAIIPKVEIV